MQVKALIPLSERDLGKLLFISRNLAPSSGPHQETGLPTSWECAEDQMAKLEPETGCAQHIAFEAPGERDSSGPPGKAEGMIRPVLPGSEVLMLLAPPCPEPDSIRLTTVCPPPSILCSTCQDFNKSLFVAEQRV